MPVPADAGVAGAQWYTIPMPGGRASRAAAFTPAGAGPFPVVLVLHGTEGLKTKHVQLAKDLASAGIVAVAACWYAGNYAGTPTNLDAPPQTTAPDGVACPGGPDFVASVTPAAVQGLQTLVAAVRTLPGVRADRFAVVGHSRGSVAALTVAAATPGTGAVVAAAGYPSAATLITLSAPVLMIQGTNDIFFPNNAQQARQFESAMKAAGKTVRSQYYDAAPHDLLFQAQWHAEAVTLASSFLKEQLAK